MTGFFSAVFTKCKALPCAEEPIPGRQLKLPPASGRKMRRGIAGFSSGGDCRPSVFLPPDAPGWGAAHMPRHMRRRRFRQGGSFPPRRDCGMSEYALPSDAAGGTRRLFPEAKPPEDQNPSDPRSGEMYASLPERDRCPGRKVGFPFSSVPGASYLFGEGCFRHFSHAACLPIRPPAPPGAGIVPAFPAFP